MRELKEANASHAKHHAKISKMAGHSDEKEDRSLVKKMVDKKALTGRKQGGSAPKSKGGTKVNVIVAPRGGQAPNGPVPSGQGPVAPVPSRPAGPPNRPPIIVAPGGANPSPSGPPPVPAGPPPGGPRPIGAKCGGGIKRRALGGKVTGYDAGAGSGEGRLEKIKHEKRRSK